MRSELEEQHRAALEQEERWQHDDARLLRERIDGLVVVFREQVPGLTVEHAIRMANAVVGAGL